MHITSTAPKSTNCNKRRNGVSLDDDGAELDGK